MGRLLLCLLLSIRLSRCTETTVAPSSAAPVQPRADIDPAGGEGGGEEPPEGYYAFVESPNATPPRVRPPPYRQTAGECPEAGEGGKAHVTANNLCGDLNRGSIPRNPMGHSVGGEPYPFELIRNHTLRFLSRTLPVLRADDTLPRVAHLAPPHTLHDADVQSNHLDSRMKRSARPDPPMEHRAMHDEPREHRAMHDEPRERKFCDGGGVFCMLYRAINGDDSKSVERREDPGPLPHPHGPHPAHPRYEGPPTPCPARVEYATPVFARNYQGVWRYVVQIPYEGYFTQTVEVTRCMQSRCHYLEGGCLSSPRWVSLLVAEMHYPQTYHGTQPLARRSDDRHAQDDAQITHSANGNDFVYDQNEDNNLKRRADTFKYPGEGFAQPGGSVGAERSQYVQRNGNYEQNIDVQNHNMQRSHNQQQVSTDTQHLLKRAGVNTNVDTRNNDNVQNVQRSQNIEEENNSKITLENNHKQKRDTEDTKEIKDDIEREVKEDGKREKRGVEDVQYRDVTEAATDKPLHCDGHDELGCYQVRLYYDWFLVPGSCKCWRPDYFARYVRRRQTSADL